MADLAETPAQEARKKPVKLRAVVKAAGRKRRLEELQAPRARLRIRAELPLLFFLLASLLTPKPAQLEAGRPSAKGTHMGADSIARRIANRDFPSVFQAWNPADNLEDEDPIVTLARHDLVFHGPEFFGLEWERDSSGLATKLTPESIGRGLAMRRKLLDLNPNIVLLAEIRYLNAWRGILPEGHRWWKYENGQLAWDSKEVGLIRLDWQNPDFQQYVAAQCKAVVESGVVDGVMLDCWQDDEDRLALIKSVRAAVGDKALIVANVNDMKRPLTSPYLNGYFME